VTRRAALYARVSTEDQADRGTIATQLDFAQKYADLHGYELVDRYCDDGISGTVAFSRRPEGQRLLDDARGRRFDVVLVYKLDRVGRRLKVILDAVDALQQLNVGIASMTESWETATPTGVFLMQILSSVAELDRTTLISRMTAGKRRVAANNKWLGGAIPFGYELGADSRLVPSDAIVPDGRTEAEVVRWIFEQVAAGASAHQVAPALTQARVPTGQVTMKPGGPRVRRNDSGLWWPERVARTVRNTIYIGSKPWGRTDPIERSYPALVSAEVWHAANARLDAARRPRGERFYLLRGLLKCGGCGRSYVGTYSHNGHGQTVTRYRCTGNKPPYRSCRYPLVNARKIEAAVWDDARRHLLENHPKPKPDDTARQLMRVENDRARLLEREAAGLIPPSEVDRRLRILARREQALKAAVPKVSATPAEARALLLAGDLTQEQMRDVLVLLCRRVLVTVDPETRKWAYVIEWR